LRRVGNSDHCHDRQRFGRRCNVLGCRKTINRRNCRGVLRGRNGKHLGNASHACRDQCYVCGSNMRGLRIAWIVRCRHQRQRGGRHVFGRRHAGNVCRCGCNSGGGHGYSNGRPINRRDRRRDVCRRNRERNVNTGYACNYHGSVRGRDV
jgi:hypothetical protein